MPTKKVVLLASVVTGLTLLVGWQRWAAQQIDRERIYRISYGTDAPFHFKGKDGLPEGLAVELVGEAARRKGIKLAWVAGADFPGAELSVLKTILPERQKLQHFTEPYLQTETWFVVLAGSPAHEASDLRTARISFVDYGIHRLNLARLVPEMQPVPGPTSRLALENLSAGRSDAAYVNEYALMPAMLGGGISAPLRIIPSRAPKGIMAIAAPFEFAAVADEIRSGMRDMVEDGTIAAIVGRRGMFPNLTADMIQELVTAKRRSQRLVASCAGLVAVLLVTVWLATRSRRQSLQLRASEEAVRRLNAQLEARVEARTAELAARVTEVEHLNQELESFSYSVSHDLRAPLRNITGFLELLARRTTGRLDAEESRYVATVTREAARMGRLIDDLLALAQVGRAEMQLARVAPGELVTEVRAELQSEIGARPVEWKIGALPAVHGDRALLHQVFCNLLGNAVKFTRRRATAIVEVGALPATADDGGVTLFVRDNGAGFNPKYSEKLFGVFQRLHNQREFEGTGIGLANVQRIIERHGGRVWAEGRVDNGATFYFNLKRHLNDYPDAAAANPTGR